MEHLIAALLVWQDGVTAERLAAEHAMDPGQVTELLDALLELGACEHGYRLVPGESLDTALAVIDEASTKPAS